ncbi:hypothetical protein NKI32_06160 [Mesorhizobium sp. M0761]|uniref:hypothetical protein n=1 Tax=unclassified Mesorhizobium TaxID=325217 RepID=UPI0033364F59
MSEITPSRKTGRPKGYIANYQPQTKTLLDAVDMVLTEYREHWPLTIRHVFYRLVGAYGYPKDESFYSKLIDHIGNARRGRVIPFNAIRDDGVVTLRMDHFDDQNHFLRHVRVLGENYHRNMLANQNLHVEVWCDAAGMLSQLFKVSREFSVQAYSSGGFDSLTAKKDLADRICEIAKPTVILHLGDYDPSGKSMFDVIAEDVSAFVIADRPWSSVTVDFKRIALTADQVFRYSLPTVPPKKTDSRTARWEGETCQLEALSPDNIAHILRSHIIDLFDVHQFHEDRDIQARERQLITAALPAPRGDA